MFYFVELLHCAGMPSDDVGKFKEILSFKEDWILYFNDKNANAIIVAIRSNNADIVEYVFDKYDIPENFNKKMVEAFFDVSVKDADPVKRIKMYEIFQKKGVWDWFEQSSGVVKGKFLPHLVVRETGKVLKKVKGWKIDWFKMDWKGNSVWEDFVSSFSSDKKFFIKFLVGKFGVEKIVNNKINGLDIVEFIGKSSLKSNTKDLLLEELNAQIKMTADNE